MSIHPIPPTPAAPFETVTFSISASEFGLLSTFMAPLGIDESKGESVWVIGRANGSRQWIATAGDRTAMISEFGLETHTQSPRSSFDWSFPVAEHVLILIGKLLNTADEISLTISDQHVHIATAQCEVTLPHAERRRIPPLPPIAACSPAVTVSAADLFLILSSATAWPAGGTTPDYEPIVSCAFDADRQQLVIAPHWGDETIGEPSYRVPATSSGARSASDEHLAFNIFHSAFLGFLRDPHTATRLGDITIHQPLPGEQHHRISGRQWMIHLPVVPDISPWGRNLGDLLPETFFFWLDSRRVRLVCPELSPGHVDLEAISSPASVASISPYRYRLTYEIQSHVSPSVYLFDEINDFNRLATGCQLVIDGSRLIARLHLTEADLNNLEIMIESFVQSVTGLSTLFAALAW